MPDLRPDVTPAQKIGLVVGGVPVVLGLLSAFLGVDLTPAQSEALDQAVTYGTVIAGTLFVSDAGLRAARNVSSARTEAAALAVPTSPHDALLSAVAEPVTAGGEDPEVDEVDEADLPDDDEEFAGPAPADHEIAHDDAAVPR